MTECYCKTASVISSNHKCSDYLKELEEAKAKILAPRKCLSCGEMSMWAEDYDYKEDALKWRALINSARLRPQGSGGLGTDHQHFGMEFWDTYPTEDHNSQGKEVLNTYVETIIKREET